MSMYALLRNNPLPTNKEMESAFEGTEGSSRKSNLFPFYHINANFVKCIWFETLVKHWNDMLSMSFIWYQSLACDKASNFSKLIS